MPLIQCLNPVVLVGPSLNTWPKWPPQLAQCSSVLVYPKSLSLENATFPIISRSKLGHPEPLSNLYLLLNKGVSQAAQV